MGLSIALQEVRYKHKIALSHISFTVSDGSFTAVIGRNGCGKSTLVSCIGGLIPYIGEITLNGIPLSALSQKNRAAHIAVMLQQLRTPHITVRDLVVFGRSPYLGIADRITETDHRRIEDALIAAELMDIADCYLDKISGGELRRAYLGMTLAQDGEILVLDEPTANLDLDHASRFIHKLRSLQTVGKTIIAVMHDLTQAMKADQIVLLDNGNQLFTGTPAAFLSEGWSEKIFHAVPVRTPEGEVFFTVK
ncbi:MAG: ABC transporter ATP-binding protein [Clostridia bacterium]|nr:ABC transporter ATP-binding protein [Clostridia bacterium]